ncbi:MAG: hypothetical protein IT176_00140 [Acidobacteria bacterium]|nr:hypothetical protein [Acidobacteriota bacterium]
MARHLLPVLLVSLVLAGTRSAAQTCTYTVAPASLRAPASGLEAEVTIEASALHCLDEDGTADRWAVPRTTDRRYEREVLAGRPSGYWRLGERGAGPAADLSGFDHPGQYVGAVGLGVPGPLPETDSSIVLDGARSYVAIGNQPGLDLASEGSVEAWVRYAGTEWSGYGPIAAKYGPAGGYFLIRDYPLGYIRWQGVGAGGANSFGLWSPAQLNDGRWHHIVGTFSVPRQQSSLYVDGTPVASSGAARAIASGVAPFQIGAWHNGDTFAGGIDDVAVYGRELSAAEVASHFASRTRIGADVLHVTITPNPFGVPRAGLLQVAGFTIALEQDGRPCDARIAPESTRVGSVGAPVPITLSIPIGCAWSASSAAGWMRLGGVSPGYAGMVRGDGAVGYWRLDEGFGGFVADSSGRGRIGAYLGGVAFEDFGATTDGAGAARFDGAGRIVVSDTPRAQPVATVSVEAWVRFTAASLTGYGPIVSTWDAGAGGYVLIRDADSGWLRWQGGAGAGAPAFVLWSRRPYHDGNWHHVVGVYDGAAAFAALYVDGQEVGSTTRAPAEIAVGDRPLEIGGWFSDGHFTGEIDEVAIYDRALTAEQVERHHALRSLAGTDVIAFDVAPASSSLERTGMLSIAGRQAAVVQAGAPCAFAASAGGTEFGAAGGGGAVDLQTLAGCEWSATSHADWIGLGQAGGSGSAALQYAVAANATGSARTGLITIAGQVISISQRACSYSFSPDRPVVQAVRSTAIVAVLVDAPCVWTPSPGTSWLRIASPDVYHQTIAADAPLGYWRLNEAGGAAAHDASGRGLDGTYAGVVDFDQAGPLRSGDAAILLSNGRAHVDVDIDSPIDLSGGVTVEGWVNFTGSEWLEYGPILSARGSSGSLFLIRDYPSGLIRWQAIRADGSTVFGLWAPESQNDGMWHHLAATYDPMAARAALYLDGAVAAETAAPATALVVEEIAIGAWPNTPGTFMGRLDEIAFFGRALSSERVAAHNGARSEAPSIGGSGSFTVEALTNPGTTERAGAIDIAGQRVPIVQAGSSCDADVSPSLLSIDWPDAQRIVSVSIADGCPWTVSSPAPWLTVEPIGSYAGTALLGAPLGYWRLDDAGAVVWDASGRGHHGIFEGARAGAAGATADANGATGFDGATGYASVDGLAMGGEVSIEAWVQFTTLAGYGPIVANDTSGGGYFLIRERDTGIVRWQGIAADGEAAFVLWSPRALQDGVWHHVAATHSAIAGTAVLYVDGSPVDAATGLQRVVGPGSSALEIGRWSRGGLFNGALDEVIVHDRALAEGEVAERLRVRGATAPGARVHATENGATTPRTASVTIAGRLVDVVQGPAPCVYTASPTMPTAPYWTSSATVTVATSANCVWSVNRISGAWARVEPAGPITGPATVVLNAEANSGDEQRRAIFTIAGHEITLFQNGSVPWLAIDGAGPGGRVSARPDGTVSVEVFDPHGSPYDAVLLFRHGEGDAAWLDWQYVTGGRALSIAGTRSATLTFRLPPEPGEYELRLFTENGRERVASGPTIVVNGPYVAIQQPQQHAVFAAGERVALVAYASDWGGMVRTVVFEIDGVVASRAPAPPWSGWWTAAAGTHTIVAVATDSNGLQAASGGVLVTVSGTAAPPSDPGAGGGGTTSPGQGVGFSGSLADWNTLTADLRISRTWIGPDVPDGLPPIVTSLQWERSSASGSWKTVTRLVSRSPAIVHGLDGTSAVSIPFGVSRVEDDEDGSPLRFFDEEGQLLQPVSDAELLQLGLAPPMATAGSRRSTAQGQAWIDSLVVPQAAAASRRERIASQFGMAVGSVGGFDRHVSGAGADQIELLVDSSRALPVERSVSRDGVLLSHETFAYAPGPDGGWIRSIITLEEAMPGGSGTRVRSTIEVLNIRLDRR